MFLAEAATPWTNPVKEHAPYATIEELLKAGFDGYYGDWANFKNEVIKAKDFYKKVDIDKKISEKFEGKKTTIAAFATHDQQSPIITGGEDYWNMVLWLNTTLPLNSYFIDGFMSGDRYVYKYENQKAEKTFTDDDQYFVHKGKMDIFNASRRPKGDKEKLAENYINAAKFKYWAKRMIVEGKYVPLRTSNPSVFAFARADGSDAVVVIGNLDAKNEIETNVYISKLKSNSFVSPVKMIEPPATKNGRLAVTLKPYEIQVFMLSKVVIK